MSSLLLEHDAKPNERVIAKAALSKMFVFFILKSPFYF
jgi:hypothetical protein